VIDTTVPGDPAQVRAAAEWLDPSLKDGADHAASEAYRIRVGSTTHWQGASGEGYRELAGKMGSAGDELATLASDSAEKLRSYAGQLERMQGDFATHRDTARDAGLTVDGNVIQPPTDPLGYCPGPGADQADLDAYEAYADKVTVYNQIATDVGSWWGELESWIADNLDAFHAGMPAQSDASGLLDTLSQVNATLVGIYLEGRNREWQSHIDDLTSRAAQAREDAVLFQRQLRSGNPAVAAAAEEANPRGLRQTAHALEDAADLLRRGGRLLPFVGPAIDVTTGAIDIANGESPSSVIVQTGGAALGGALVVGGLALAGVTAPVWGTAVAVGVAGVAVGAGAVWAYENWVPQDVRESIDAGLENAWDATTDFADDAWDNVSGGVSDAWNSVFG
jgi:hypothetical protein